MENKAVYVVLILAFIIGMVASFFLLAFTAPSLGVAIGALAVLGGMGTACLAALALLILHN